MVEPNENESPYAETEDLLDPHPALEEGISHPLAQPRTSISAWRLVGLIGIIWGIELSLGIAIVIAVSLQSGGDTSAESTVAFSMPIILFTMAISWTATILLCTYFGCVRYSISFSRGFSLRRVESKALVHSVKLGIGFAFFAILVSVIGGDEKDAPILELVESDAASHASGIPILFMFFAIVVAPLEELYYRGFMFRSFQKLIATPLSAALIVIWFGMVHSFQVGGQVLMIAVIMSLGGVCTYLRIRYKSVIPSMACHFTYNVTLMGITLLSYLFAE